MTDKAAILFNKYIPASLSFARHASISLVSLCILFYPVSEASNSKKSAIKNSRKKRLSKDFKINQGGTEKPFVKKN